MRLAIGVTGVVIAAGAIAPTFRASKPPTPTPTATPTTALATGKNFRALPDLIVARVATVLSNRIVERYISITVDNGPIGLLFPSLVWPPVANTLSLTGTFAVAQGGVVKNGGETGTWSYDLAGRRPQLFLGMSTGFVPSVQPDRVWMTTDTQTWEVDAAVGTVTNGPYPLDGRLIASVGAGLLLQRGAHVVWWHPSLPVRSVGIGLGRALAGLHDRILWESTEGEVTVSDPLGQGRTPPVARVDPTEYLGPAALSPGGRRLALGSGDEVVLAEIKPRSNPVRVLPGGPATDLAWLNDDIVVVRIGHRGLVAIDARTQLVLRCPDFDVDASGLAVVDGSR